MPEREAIDVGPVADVADYKRRGLTWHTLSASRVETFSTPWRAILPADQVSILYALLNARLAVAPFEASASP